MRCPHRMRARLGAFGAHVALLAGCNNGKVPTFQGWVEANLIFVGPDETGRIETLTIREGDRSRRGAAVHARCRSATRRSHAGSRDEERTAGL